MPNVASFVSIITLYVLSESLVFADILVLMWVKPRRKNVCGEWVERGVRVELCGGGRARGTGAGDFVLEPV